MAGVRIFLLILGIGLCLGTEDPQPPRPTRTIARLFGLDGNVQPQPQQHPAVQHPHQQQVQTQQIPVSSQQVRKPVPLIYSVKYYDRTGEGEKVEVVPDNLSVQDRVQGVPARVFLNLYTGQQTPVYYDNKGQLLVPCPVYDHLYVAGVDQSLIRKPPPAKVVQTPVVPVPQPVPVSQVQQVPQIVPVPEFVYYATPSFVGHPPVPPPPKTNQGHGGVTYVGVPYDYPYFPGIYPYGSTGPFNNPYLYIKPTPPGHHGGHHGQPSGTVVQIQQPVAQVVEKKEGEKTD